MKVEEVLIAHNVYIEASLGPYREDNCENS